MSADLRTFDAGSILPVSPHGRRPSDTWGSLADRARRLAGAAALTLVVTGVVALIVWLAPAASSARDCERYGSCSLAAIMQFGMPD